MIKREFNGKKVILVDDLSPEDIAMIQALYARRATSAEEHIQAIYDGRREALRKELQHWVTEADIPLESLTGAVCNAAFGQGATERAGKFMSSFYVGYNHQSIGDCGTFTLFIEGVSTLVAKALQDSPLYNGQETSTRAIDFSDLDNPNRVVGRINDPINTPLSGHVQHCWMDFYNRRQDAVAAETCRRFPRQSDEDEVTYERAIKARVFDIMRGFLPAGVTTQLSLHTSIRHAADRLQVLVHHPLSDVREVVTQLKEMLHEKYPSSGFVVKSKTEEWDALVGTFSHPYSYDDVEAGYFKSTFDKYALLLLQEPLLQQRPKFGLVPHFLTDLGQCSFSFLLDFGSFRDIQRHRAGVCHMPLLTTEYGFEQWYLDQLDDNSRFEAELLLVKMQKLIAELRAEHADEAQLQNYIAMGYRVVTDVTYGLPAAVYVMELRTGKTVHPTLRKAVQDHMVKPFSEEFPYVKLHVDMEQDSWNLRRGTQTIERKAV